MAKLYSSAPRISANPRGREIHFEKGVAEVTDLEAADLMALNSPDNELFSTKPFGGGISELEEEALKTEEEALKEETLPVIEEKPKAEEGPSEEVPPTAEEKPKVEEKPEPKASSSRKKAGSRKKSTKKSRR